jgi:hypothetical protein
MDRRWYLGAHELKFNPKANSSSMNRNGDTAMTANGVLSSNVLMYEREMDFTIDVYDKPTEFGDPILRTNSSKYISLTQSRSANKMFLLQKGTNLFDIYDSGSGALISAGKNANFGGSIAQYMIAIDSSRLVAIYPNGDLTTFDENGIQISKYTYSDNDYRTSNSITWDGDRYYYVLCKYGKIMTIDKTNGTLSDFYTFDDYFDNSTFGSNAPYRGIHFADFSKTLLGVMKDNLIMYFDTSMNVVTGINIDDRYIASVSSEGIFYNSIALTYTEVLGFTPNLSGAEVQNIKNIASAGAFVITDENNVTRTMFPSSLSVNRLRNKKDSRYEISISGKIV